MSKLLEQVGQRFAARQTEEDAARAATASAQIGQEQAYRRLVLALARGKRPPADATPEAVEALLLATGRGPEDLEASVDQARILFAEAARLDPVGAVVAGALASAEVSKARLDRERLEREADERVRRAVEGVQAAARRERVEHGSARAVLDSAPVAVSETYFTALRALDVARQRLEARVVPGGRVGGDLGRTSVESLLAEVDKAGEAARAAWARVVEQAGEREVTS